MAKQIEINADATVWAGKLNPPHAVRDTAKLNALVADMEANGWTGRPIPVEPYGDGYLAFTGSHRIAAARKAQIEVPIVIVDAVKAAEYQESNGMPTDRNLWDDMRAMDDEDRAEMLRQVGDERIAALIDAEVAANA